MNNLEWIKVTVRHAEYDFVGAPDNVFRSWIMAMILTAAMETVPGPFQLEKKLGKNEYNSLVKYLKENGTPLEKILKKVMEDVTCVRRQRKHNRDYMLRSRGIDTSGAPQGRHVGVRRNVDIREDKIREDKSVFKGLKELAKKDPEMKKNLEKLGIGVKE